MKNRLQKILNFLVETEKLKLVERISVLSDGIRRENDAEHSWHLALMVMALKSELKLDFDLEIALKIALVHDLPEIYTGDTWPANDEEKRIKKEKEDAAAEKIFSFLPRKLAKEFKGYWQEYEEGESIESKVVKALDKICYSLQFSISNKIIYFTADSGHERRQEYALPYLKFNNKLKDIFDHFSLAIRQEPQPEIKPGIYEHFKGGRYKVIGTAKHSETLEDMVIYMPLYESEMKLWSRPKEMFSDEVEVDGKKIRRFTFLG